MFSCSARLYNVSDKLLPAPYLGLFPEKCPANEPKSTWWSCDLTLAAILSPSSSFHLCCSRPGYKTGL